MTGEPFPTCGTYRGVSLFAYQGPERLEAVKRNIDEVHAITEPVELASWAGDQLHSPESRLFVASKCEATFEICAEQREVRPRVDLLKLRASTVGLDILGDADRDYYCSIFDVQPPGPRRAARRLTPLPERR